MSRGGDGYGRSRIWYGVLWVVVSSYGGCIELKSRGRGLSNATIEGLRQIYVGSRGGDMVYRKRGFRNGA